MSGKIKPSIVLSREEYTVKDFPHTGGGGLPEMIAAFGATVKQTSVVKTDETVSFVFSIPNDPKIKKTVLDFVESGIKITDKVLS